MTARPGPMQESEVTQLVLEVYGLRMNFVDELTGYSDRNYLLERALSQPCFNVADSNSNKPCQYVLKVLDLEESKKPRKIAIQNDLVLLAKKAGFPLPVPQVNLKGSYQKLISFQKENGVAESASVRLVDYLPGVTLDKVKLTKSLCRQIGHMAGWLDKIWQTKEEYDVSLVSLFQHSWNLTQLPSLRSTLRLGFLEDPQKEALAEDIISAFEEDVLAHLDKFSKGFIHNDLNECNIIVCPISETTKEAVEQEPNGLDPDNNCGTQPNVPPETEEQIYTLNGVIDFGDLSLSLHIFEVAIAMAYSMMNKYGVPPLEAAGCILSGYLKHIKLSDFELQRLRVCVCARLVQSSVNGLQFYKNHPDDVYVLSHASRVWEPMGRVWLMPNEEFLTELMKEINENPQS